MIEINREKGEIVISETLSFDCHVKPIFDEIQDDFRYCDEADKYKLFIDYELTALDKAEILEMISDSYQRESEFYETSIFDKDLIITSVKEWITDNFDIEDFNF